MPAPIIMRDLSGLSEGLSKGFSSATSALSEALGTRQKEKKEAAKIAEKEKKQKESLGVISEWASNYDTTKSPIENMGTLQNIINEKGIDPTTVQPLIQDIIKKSVSQQGDLFGAKQVFGEQELSPIQDVNKNIQEGDKLTPQQAPVDKMARFSNEDLVMMSSNPNQIVSKTAKSEIEKRKLQQRVDSDERDWHTKFTIDQEKKVAALRESIPKKRSALAHSRQAIESGETQIMTGTWLADKTGIEAFRGVEGAQLEVAAKEHFFGNMARVSAKAQNIFFEKMLKNMFAQVGQTKETALAFNEMLNGEINMDEAYQKAYDRIAKQDEETFNYTRKDADRRARDEVAHLEDLNLDRTLYRIQRLAEAQQSPKNIKKNLMKTVANGTPLTLEKKFMFLDKFDGDASKAIKAAKRLGYRIPNAGEVHLYSMTNREFAKKMGGE